jgi:ABC-type bacteriocin/lantibiotic exporter with double-glycine peptidase domain
MMAGRLTIGALLSLAVNAVLILQPIKTVVAHVRSLRLASAGSLRLQHVLHAKPEQASPQSNENEGRNGALAPRLDGAIELRGVSFRHGKGGEEVLKGISFRVSPGQKVALVGPSGAGKSTLLRILLGLARPTEGEVLYDAKPLSGLDLRAVRRQIGAVLQGSGLFNRTLRHNITPDDSYRPLAVVREAAKRARIDDDIMGMSQGYRTYAGEDGCNLSGGQKQRVLIARALIRSPKYLFLDEATSELDALTERAISEELDGLAATQVVVAHRLHAIANADLIVVLDGGAIVERGTHDELMARGGLYSRMVEKQSGGLANSEGAIGEGVG